MNRTNAIRLAGMSVTALLASGGTIAALQIPQVRTWVGTLGVATLQRGASTETETGASSLPVTATAPSDASGTDDTAVTVAPPANARTEEAADNGMAPAVIHPLTAPITEAVEIEPAGDPAVTKQSASVAPSRPSVNYVALSENLQEMSTALEEFNAKLLGLIAAKKSEMSQPPARTGPPASPASKTNKP